ncbi:MAG: hypothetical protein ACKVPX_03415 [Myxococcaceae bacterium]
MRHRFFMIPAGALLSFACATASSPQVIATPSTPRAVLPEFALVSGLTNDVFVLELPITSAPPPKNPFTVVEVSSGRVLKAQVADAGGIQTGTAVRFPLAWPTQRLEAGRLGVALLHTEGSVTASQFRECTSAEGVHVTVWEGTPLKSRLRWHGYWYAGYDLEPNCEPGEVPPAGDASSDSPPNPKTEDAK